MRLRTFARRKYGAQTSAAARALQGAEAPSLHSLRRGRVGRCLLVASTRPPSAPNPRPRRSGSENLEPLKGRARPAYLKGLRGLSTRLAHCSDGPCQRSSSAPALQPSPSTWPLSRLYANSSLAALSAMPMRAWFTRCPLKSEARAWPGVSRMRAAAPTFEKVEMAEGAPRPETRSPVTQRTVALKESTVTSPVPATGSVPNSRDDRYSLPVMKPRDFK